MMAVYIINWKINRYEFKDPLIQLGNVSNPNFFLVK